MARRKSGEHRRPRAAPARLESPAPAPEPAGRADRVRPWLLAAASGLWVCPLLYPSDAPVEWGAGLPVVMLWLALAVFWLLGAVGRPLRVRFGWADGAVVVLAGLHTASAIWAAARASPRPAVNMLWEWIGLAVGFLLMRQVVAGPREARAVIAVMVAMAVVLAGYGIYQYVYALPTMRQLYEQDPEAALQLAEQWRPPGSPERKLLEDRLRAKEPFATFALANSLAGYLAPWLILTLGIALWSATAQPKRTPLWSLGALAAAVPPAGCLILTKSRSAYLATFLGVVLLALWAGRRRMRASWPMFALIAAVSVILVTVVIALGGLDVEVITEAGKSLGYRFQYWIATLGMIGEHPWLGCGPGNFQHAYPAYKLPEASEEVADPHNFLLEVWATSGTPAMLAFLAVIAAFFGAVFKGSPSSGREVSSSIRPARSAVLDRPAFALGGGLAAFGLTALVRALCGAPDVGLPLLGIGGPLAIGTGAVLVGWVYGGELPAAFPAVGILVLLVNLSAAGGAAYAGVAGTLWLLLALGLNQLRPDPGHPVPRPAVVGLLGLAMATLGACYWSAYRPVLACRQAMAMAGQNPVRRESYLLAAAKADPLAAEPWWRLAAWAVQTWDGRPASPALGRFRQYSQAALARSPNSSGMWFAIGRQWEEFHSATGTNQHLRWALDCYQEAVARYPNNATYRGRLALALAAAGQQEDAIDQAEAALRLDRLTPHADQKLDSKDPKLRSLLERMVSKRN